MAITYGFYNSVAGDRVYDAVDLSSIFDGIITDGVFESIGNKLIPVAGTGMQVVVGSGRAWFNRTWTLNDADLPLSIAASDPILDRIDTVVLEVDSSVGVRANTIKVIQGTPGALAVPPTLVETAEVHQHPLAHVAVGFGVTSITTGKITVLVDSPQCPFVTIVGVTVVGGGGGGADVLQVQVFS